ncbi:tRNA (adenosine(37)-N6)-threonylcarbamoyltransferase complex dimerization subunit type 1 TsaB [Thiohalorhabdus sp.]|uniref:tRNA (adenosine(37)-N6)-threonylcarbamoyltransferase complex dimerization subunit type 1 TsaB n=1 Tax=Thiohalorhabdus sp. TaxID=3094134 RepID=UPI002FC28E97
MGQDARAVTVLPAGPFPGTLAALAGTADATSAAILHRGRLHLRHRSGRAQHVRHLLPLLDELLADLALARTDLEAVAFARGPGPFTAGRIVVATAQGLGLGLGVPLIPVSSLAASAWVAECHQCAVALEAGRGEVYWGRFRRTSEGMEGVGEEQVAAPEALALPGAGSGSWWGVGSGWSVAGEMLAARMGPALAGTSPEISGEADAVAALALASWRDGATLTSSQAVPTYLRASYAEESAG